jgi:hypothetical protein
LTLCYLGDLKTTNNHVSKPGNMLPAFGWHKATRGDNREGKGQTWIASNSWQWGVLVIEGTVVSGSAFGADSEPHYQ